MRTNPESEFYATPNTLRKRRISSFTLAPETEARLEELSERFQVAKGRIVDIAVALPALVKELEKSDAKAKKKQSK